MNDGIGGTTMFLRIGKSLMAIVSEFISSNLVAHGLIATHFI